MSSAQRKLQSLAVAFGSGIAYHRDLIPKPTGTGEIA